MAWSCDRKSLEFWGRFPTEMGVVFEREIKALAKELPEFPATDGIPGLTDFPERRAADALYLLVSRDGPDRPGPAPTVTMHVELADLLSGGRGEIVPAPVLSSETIERLMCDAKIEAVLHRADGYACGIATVSRRPTEAMMRELERRDRAASSRGVGGDASSRPITSCRGPKGRPRSTTWGCSVRSTTA